MHGIFWMVIGYSGTCSTVILTVMHGIFWMVIGHSGTCSTVILSPHGNARYFLDGYRPLWYVLPWHSALAVMHGIFWMVIGHSV